MPKELVELTVKIGQPLKPFLRIIENPELPATHCLATSNLKALRQTIQASAKVTKINNVDFWVTGPDQIKPLTNQRCKYCLSIIPVSADGENYSPEQYEELTLDDRFHDLCVMLEASYQGEVVNNVCEGLGEHKLLKFAVDPYTHLYVVSAVQNGDEAAYPIFLKKQ